MVNTTQALQIVTQAIDIAVGNGIFKSTKDVVVISTSLNVLAEALGPDKDMKQAKELKESE